MNCFTIIFSLKNSQDFFFLSTVNKVTYDKFCCMREDDLNEIIQDASEKKQTEFKTLYCFFKKSIKISDNDIIIENDIGMDVDIANCAVIIDQSVESSVIEQNRNLERTSSCYTVVDDNEISEENDIEPN